MQTFDLVLGGLAVVGVAILVLQGTRKPGKEEARPSLSRRLPLLLLTIALGGLLFRWVVAMENPLSATDTISLMQDPAAVDPVGPDTRPSASEPAVPKVNDPSPERLAERARLIAEMEDHADALEKVRASLANASRSHTSSALADSVARTLVELRQRINLLKNDSAFAPGIPADYKGHTDAPMDVGGTGWSIYGLRVGTDGWADKYFDLERKGGPAMPTYGDRVVATADVNIRAGYIEYVREQGWVNHPVLGVAKPQMVFSVTDTKFVAVNYLWVKLTRVE